MMTAKMLTRGARDASLAIVTTLGLSLVVSGHVDDPKVKDTMPPYVGPGFRAAEGGVAGGSGSDFVASGVSLQSWIPVQEFDSGTTGANDCWGYTSPSGREYAMIGLSNGTGFAEVTNPASAQVIGFIDGPSSTWRDIKTYDTYAYAVSEAGSGIQVFDLSQIDDGIVTLANTITTGGSTASHNVALNEDSGYLYRCGGSGNGLRIYSLEDPLNPTFVASWPDRYVHDAQIVSYTEGPYAGKEIAFVCSGLNNGWVQTGIDIIDVTDKQNITVMATYEYPNGVYSHQAWLSEDKQYLYLNDEQDEDQLGWTSTMRVINVSNLNAPFQATTFTNGSSAITHNLYTRGNLVFAANYRSGLRVIDVSAPLSPVEVGYFDTFPGSDAANFNGLWSNYPYFPSGTVIGSDRERGLFVWIYGGPDVTISYPDGLPDKLDPNGQSIMVSITDADGAATIFDASLYVDSGEGFQQTAMTPLGGGLWEGEFPQAECGVEVAFYVAAQSGTGTVWRDPITAPSGAYTAVVASEAELNYLVEFELDAGWIVGVTGDTASTGVWERVDPNGTTAQPGDDHSEDGTKCYVTGQGPFGGGLGENDVDDGWTTLMSNAINGEGDGIGYLSYARWYSNDQGDNPNADSMIIEISNDNGSNWTLLEEVTENANAWVVRHFRIEDFVEPSSQMRLRFIASDLDGGSIVEAAVDDVRIDHYQCDATNSPDINGDGFVNIDDLVEVILAWGPCDEPPAACPADIDGNGAVDVDDLVAVIANWS